MKQKKKYFKIARGIITGMLLILCASLTMAQPSIIAPDGFAAYQGTTGGGNATPIIVSTASDLVSAVSGSSPKVIYVDGLLDVGGNISIGSNTTLVGMTESSGIISSGVQINGTNYIIQNLTFGPSSGDVMEISGATKVFITKCTFHDSSDELCSIVRAADYVTVSWCRFYFDNPDSHSFAHLIGNSDGATGDRGKLHVTMHHNWYDDGVKGRQPRVRFGQVHIYNNYWNSNNADYCIGTGLECHVRVENSHFDNVDSPWADYGDNNEIGWSNLLFEGCSQPTYMPNSYPVFSVPYSYSLDPVNNVESIVRAGAGNVIGGGPTTYILTTSVNGQGSVNPSGGTYNEDTQVTLTATAASGWTFTNWSGDASGSSNPVTITMNSNKSVTANFTQEDIPVTGVSVNPTSSTIAVGQSVQLNASVEPANATNQNVSWNSSDEAFATVSSSGVVTGVAVGSATITVTTADGGFTADASITVEESTGECTWVEYQAEDGSMSAGSMDDNNSGYTGSGFANTDNELGVWYEIDVNVPTSGIHDIAVRFANGSSTDRAQEISVNGSTQISSQSFPSTGSWTTWTIVEFSLNLSAGDNTIRFTSLTSSGAPNLDRIDVCQGGATPTQYTLSTSANGQGTVSGAGTYDEGTVVSVTATPDTDWQFDGWSGDASGTDNPVSITMDANKSVTANFSQIPVNTYTLSTSVNGQGSVSGAGTYTEGSVATVTATPAAGWVFENWSGDASGSDNPVSVTMDANKSVTANFVEDIIDPTGVSVSPTSNTILVGGTVQLVASVIPSNATNQNVTWSSNNSSVATVSSSGLVTGVAEGSATITVTTEEGGFTADASITVEESTGECTWVEYQAEDGSMSAGSMDNNNSGYTGTGFANTDNVLGVWYEIDVNVPSAGVHDISVRFANGSTTDRAQEISVNGSTQISSQSFPSTGSWTTWTIVEFSLNLSAGDNTIRFTSLTSSGAPNLDRIDVCQGGSTTPTYTLTTSTSGQGSVSGAGTYDEGTVVSVTATPDTDWQFDGWSGDVSGTANPLSIIMDANKSVTANFSQIPVNTYTLAISTNGQGTVSGAGTYNEGTVVSVTATPDPGWQFDGWSGDASGTANPLSITMDENKSVTANFSEVTGTVTTITIQENEDGFCSVDGSVDDDNSGFTGDGFANTDNENDNGITWSVNVPSTGTYTLVWRIANGSSTNRTAEVMVDGSVEISNVDFPSTGSWTSWTTLSGVDVTLPAGTSLIRLQATQSSGLANIDYLEVTGINPTPVACSGQKSSANITDVSDINSELGFNVYPNPTRNMLTIELNRELKDYAIIQLFDNTGRLIVNNKVKENIQTLDMSGLQSGIYLLKVSDTKETIVKRIVKQ